MRLGNGSRVLVGVANQGLVQPDTHLDDWESEAGQSRDTEWNQTQLGEKEFNEMITNDIYSAILRINP